MKKHKTMAFIGDNPAFSGALALMAGNFLGSSIDSLVKVLNDRANLTAGLPLNASTKRILDNSISILLQVTAVGLGTHFISNAFPWLTADPAAFTMWIIGVSMSSDTLRTSVRALNDSLRFDVGGRGANGEGALVEESVGGQ